MNTTIYIISNLQFWTFLCLDSKAELFACKEIKISNGFIK